jgi:hypothetical protein
MGKNHIAKSKFVEEYVRTIKPTKYLAIEFSTKIKCVVRICENHFCMHTYFKCDDATKCTKNLKYVERYVSGTNAITYFEYLALTQSMSSQ